MILNAGNGIRLSRADSEHNGPLCPLDSWGYFTPPRTRALCCRAVQALVFMLILTAVRSSAAPLVFDGVQGHRVADLEIPSEGHAGFTLVPPEVTGIWFSNTVPE